MRARLETNVRRAYTLVIFNLCICCQLLLPDTATTHTHTHTANNERRCTSCVVNDETSATRRRDATSNKPHPIDIVKSFRSRLAATVRVNTHTHSKTRVVATGSSLWSSFVIHVFTGALTKRRKSSYVKVHSRIFVVSVNISRRSELEHTASTCPECLSKAYARNSSTACLSN